MARHAYILHVRYLRFQVASRTKVNTLRPLSPFPGGRSIAVQAIASHVAIWIGHALHIADIDGMKQPHSQMIYQEFCYG